MVALALVLLMTLVPTGMSTVNATVSQHSTKYAEQFNISGETAAGGGNLFAAPITAPTTESTDSKAILKATATGGLVTGLSVSGVGMFVWTDYKKTGEEIRGL